MLILTVCGVLAIIGFVLYVRGKQYEWACESFAQVFFNPRTEKRYSNKAQREKVKQVLLEISRRLRESDADSDSTEVQNLEMNLDHAKWLAEQAGYHEEVAEVMAEHYGQSQAA
jgi:hypothetical protein